MTDTADWLRMYAQQLEDQHAPQNLTIGMRQAADQLDASRETTLQLLGQVGQLSDELERLKDCEARLRAALERIADTDPDDGTEWFHNVARAALDYRKMEGK